MPGEENDGKRQTRPRWHVQGRPPILGGVGLGICSACNAPGAFWYPFEPPSPFDGVWICDSCVHPELVGARISRSIQTYRDDFSRAHPLTDDSKWTLPPYPREPVPWIGPTWQELVEDANLTLTYNRLPSMTPEENHG